MTTIEEFIATRINIETLADKITQSVKNNTVHHSKAELDEAKGQLEKLKSMVSNDVQEIVAGRLTRQLTDLEAKVSAKVAKMPSKKTGERKTRSKSTHASSGPHGTAGE